MLGRGDIPAEAEMAPPAVRETLKEGRDRSIKHTDGEINVSIEINDRPAFSIVRYAARRRVFGVLGQGFRAIFKQR